MKNVEELDAPLTQEVIEKLQVTLDRQATRTFLVLAILSVLGGVEGWVAYLSYIQFPSLFYLAILAGVCYATYVYFGLINEHKELEPAPADALVSIDHDIETLPGANEYLARVQALGRSVTRGEINKIARLANLRRLEIEQVN